jgi:DNA-binding IclR family transcriptional regulator
LSRLANLATPLMHQAAAAANQELHMAILDSTSIRIIAQVDSPAPIGFRLRVGTRNPAMATASGRLLVAWQAPAIRDWLLDEMRRDRPKEEADALARRTQMIRAKGYEMVTGESLQGITEVSFPLIDSSGFAQAVLTMPYLPAARPAIGFDEACEIVLRTAEAITILLGGVPPKISLPLARVAAKRPPNRRGAGFQT